MSIEIDNTVFYVRFKEKKLFLSDNPESDGILYIKRSENNDGIFYLGVSENGYLVTNPNRECALHSQNDQAWERITLLPKLGKKLKNPSTNNLFGNILTFIKKW